MHRTTLSLQAMRLTLDVMSLLFVLTMLLLTVLFPEAVPEWRVHAAGFVVAGVLYAGAVWVARLLRNRFTGTAIHVVAVLGLFSFLFGAVAGLQHVFVNRWMDAAVLQWEYALVGKDILVSLQEYVSPALTEWMMFAYVIYVPLLPLVAIACWRAAGPRAAIDYLMNLSLANMMCYAGFILFPVAGPLVHYPEVFTAPLDGGLFAWCGEWMRTNVHYPGGCLPSPHCAAATVMLVMLYRYNRKLSYVVLPIILTLYVSTVYGLYHYMSDSVVGILVAVVVLRFSPLLVRCVEYAAEKMRYMVRPVSMPESIVE